MPSCWGRSTLGTRSAQRANAELFRCECGHEAWKPLAEFLETGSWAEYEHCGQVMEMVALDGRGER